MRTIQVPGPDGNVTDLSISDTAIPIISLGPPGAAEQLSTIQGIKDVYAREDSRSLTRQSGAYANWLADVGHARDLNLPPAQWAPKPQQGLAHAVNVAVDTTNIAWLWITTSPLGTPCPDLPPVTPVQPTPGTIQVGNHNWGMYWAQGPLDNPPDDVFQGKTVQATSLDGVAGTWMFIGHPMSSPIYGRKGWYLKVG